MKHVVGRLVLVAAMLGVVVPAAVAGSSPAAAAQADIDCAPLPSGGAATAPPMESYTPINPVRLVDTRNNIGGVDVPLDPGCTMIVSVGADIPAAAQAVALSMTAVNSQADFFTVYPCASGRPDDVEPQRPRRLRHAEPRGGHPRCQSPDLRVQPRSIRPDHRPRRLVVRRTEPLRVDRTAARLRQPPTRTRCARPTAGPGGTDPHVGDPRRIPPLRSST